LADTQEGACRLIWEVDFARRNSTKSSFDFFNSIGRYTPATRYRKTQRNPFATSVQIPDGFKAKQGVTFIHGSK
jgi:hypothetical protein